MRVTVCARPSARITDGGLAVLVFEDDLSPLEQLSAEIAGQAKARARQTDFVGKKDTRLVIPFGADAAGTLVVAGLGKAESVTRDTWRQAAAGVAKQAEKDRCGSLAILPPFQLDEDLSSCLAEGVVLGLYRFDRYKSASSTEDEPPRLESVEIAQSRESGLKRGAVLAESQNYARDLVNEPGNVINPASLAAEAQRLASETGIDCTVYEEPELREMGMNGLLGVGGGSATPPRLIHMVYRPDGGAKAKIAFVGKGITFDSGGLNIKPGDYMRSMKGDKTGA
ncbi:MAG: M17 family peptidase N-terminal domain-containing protein, partial [Synergistota bacterium]|nr:M17 family peptidase N-terminal domain-containing protein [Synergistota bacterium]